jgi:tetratricopeptide (TPR) repeat protein
MASSTRSQTRRAAAAALVAVYLLQVPAALAAPDPAEVKAKAAFKKAQADYDLGEFREALAKYSEAYRLKPLPAFLFNIGQCHRQLRQYERARFFYRRYLDLSKTRPSNADTVEQLIQEMDAKMQAAAAEAKAKEEAEAKAAEAEALVRTKEAEARAAQARALEPTRAPGAEGPGAAPAAVTAAVEPAQPLTKKWWFWTGIGAVALLGITIIANGSVQPTPTNLDPINARN